MRGEIFSIFSCSYWPSFFLFFHIKDRGSAGPESGARGAQKWGTERPAVACHPGHHGVLSFPVQVHHHRCVPPGATTLFFGFSRHPVGAKRDLSRRQDKSSREQEKSSRRQEKSSRRREKSSRRQENSLVAYSLTIADSLTIAANVGKLERKGRGREGWQCAAGGIVWAWPRVWYPHSRLPRRSATLSPHLSIGTDIGTGIDTAGTDTGTAGTTGTSTTGTDTCISVGSSGNKWRGGWRRSVDPPRRPRRRMRHDRWQNADTISLLPSYIAAAILLLLPSCSGAVLFGRGPLLLWSVVRCLLPLPRWRRDSRDGAPYRVNGDKKATGTKRHHWCDCW